MAVKILSHFTATQRRSAPRGTGDLLTGRWAAVDANGQAVVPGAGSKIGLYLVLEGNLIHIGSPTDFDTSPFPSTNSEQLPANKASNQVALAYGVFRYEVGPEGCNPGASYSVRDLVTSDNFGRLITTTDEELALGSVEAVTTDTSSNVTKLVIRTFGK